jgi:hypothetical protein
MLLESLVVFASIVLALLACFSRVSVYAQDIGQTSHRVTITHQGIDRATPNARSASNKT